jgi:hypothetical protein
MVTAPDQVGVLDDPQKRAVVGIEQYPISIWPSCFTQAAKVGYFSASDDMFGLSAQPDAGWLFRFQQPCDLVPAGGTASGQEQVTLYHLTPVLDHRGCFAAHWTPHIVKHLPLP